MNQKQNILKQPPTIKQADKCNVDFANFDKANFGDIKGRYKKIL